MINAFGRCIKLSVSCEWSSHAFPSHQIDLDLSRQFRDTTSIENGIRKKLRRIDRGLWAIERMETIEKKNEIRESTRKRPAMFRALGPDEPPSRIEVDGKHFELQTIFKHDSWAATALYQGNGTKVVCKFNRVQSCAGIPMRWLGKWLARREATFFRLLEFVPGIPASAKSVMINGRIAPTAFCHEFIPGRPLSLVHDPNEAFFNQLSSLLDAIHARQMAYVDLNKPENVLVGDDGRPYLFDFQISLRFPDWPVARWMLRVLQQSDRYHLMKHRTWRLNRAAFEQEMERHRPWWIRWHRKAGVPLRNFRRRLLVWLRIRQGQGAAHTEVAPEHGLCTAEKVAANKRVA